MNKYDELNKRIGNILLFLLIAILVLFFVSIQISGGLLEFNDENILIFDILVVVIIIILMAAKLYFYIQSNKKILFGETIFEIIANIFKVFICLSIIYFFMFVSFSTGYGGTEKVVDKYEIGVLNILVIDNNNDNYELICNEEVYLQVNVGETLEMSYRSFGFNPERGLLLGLY